MFWSNLGFEDPWVDSGLQTVRQLQEQMNRLFEHVHPESRGSFPPVNLWVGSEQAIVTAELPGVDAKQLDLSVTGNVLTLSGERKLEDLGEKDRYIRHERGCGQFTKTVELPYVVDSDKVDATYKNGVLKVVLSRAESDKPKKIAIK